MCNYGLHDKYMILEEMNLALDGLAEHLKLVVRIKPEEGKVFLKKINR